ncbi:MAG: hypothetical protein JNL03_09425 [Prolixibacteraceae bacterium]|nr:hypothetical protein [Prolixibacteraceae bacterium]
MNVKLATPETTTNPEDARFELQDVTTSDAEILMEALVLYKSKLDAEEFRDTRKSCIDMFNKLDTELIRFREQRSKK